MLPPTLGDVFFEATAASSTDKRIWILISGRSITILVRLGLLFGAV